MIDLTGDLTNFTCSQIESQATKELKSRVFKDGKLNRSAIMRQAWAQARILAGIYGKKACEFFAAQLKEVWAKVK